MIESENSVVNLTGKLLKLVKNCNMYRFGIAETLWSRIVVILFESCAFVSNIFQNAMAVVAHCLTY
jgi:hypothetical protein